MTFSAVEAVAHSPYTQEKRRCRRMRFDLSPQVDDVGIHGAVRHVDVTGPRRVEQLFPAEHASSPLDEGP